METPPPYSPDINESYSSNKPSFFSRLYSHPRRNIGMFVMLAVVLLVSYLVYIGIGNSPTKSPSVSSPQDSKYTRLKIPERDPPFFSLSEETVRKFGIIPTETLILQSAEAVSKDFLESVVEASVPVSIRQVNADEYQITPTRSLSADEIFQVRLAVKDEEYEGHAFDRDYSWSFQTQGKFRVVSSIPGDRKTNVPVNTGIEFVFSQDDYKDPERFISIEPPVEHRLERHEETLSIVPLKPLDYETVYTVRLRSGLDLESRSDPIAEDVVFSFQTKQRTRPEGSISLSKNLIERTPSDPPTVKISSSNAENLPIKAEVYQFPDSSKFIESRRKIDEARASWYSYYPQESDIDVTSLQSVKTYDLQIEKEEEVDHLGLPEPLPRGYYYVRFEYGSNNRYEELWVQVSDLSGFVSVGEKSTVVWVNTLSDSQPVPDALVSVYGFNTPYFTNGQGYIKFDTPETLLNYPGGYVYVVKDEHEIVLPIRTSNNHTKETKEDYWAYLYNERRFYKPTDTMHIWGMVKHRDRGVAPENLTVELSKGGSYYSESGSSRFKLEKEINVSGDKATFNDSISFSNVAPGYYTLEIKTGDLVLANTYVNVLNYVKPEMQIDVSSEKNAIFSDQSVDFNILSTFFDNTPTSNLELSLTSSWNANTPPSITVDQSGQATYTYTPAGNDDYYSSYIRTECITVVPRATSESNIEGNGCVRVFYRTITVDSDSTSEGNKAQLRMNVHHVDLDKYNTESQNGYKGDPAVGKSARVVVTKKWSERIEKEPVYDYIEKVTRPSYEYVQKQEKVSSIELQTDVQGIISHDFDMENNRSYEVDITIDDDNGEQIATKEFFYNYGRRYTTATQQDTSPRLGIKDKEDNLFVMDEQVELEIHSGDSLYPDNDANTFLFIVSSRGRQDVYVQDSPSLTFAFDKGHIPNAAASAVVFTGSSYSVVGAQCHSDWYCRSVWYWYHFNNTLPELSLVYDKKERDLSLSFSYDHSVYQPSDEAQVTVSVADKYGQSVSGAEVNIALVDQALAAIGGAREPSILSSLYPTVRSGLYYSYNSHKPLIPDEPQAEMGGGGGGGDRELFKDTAFFGRAETDAQGNAEFTFDLPDNITTWNIYGQAVTSDVSAGHETGTLVTTKDFFVLPAFISTFLTKDSPQLTGSAFGTGLSKSDNIDFTAVFTRNGNEIDEITQRGDAFAQYEFPFPSLPQGAYQLSLEGTSQEKRDSVTLPFEVVRSRFSVRKQHQEVLGAGEEFMAINSSGILTNRPYHLVVSDEGKGKFYSNFRSYCYFSSNRLEKMLAKKVAGEVLQEQFRIDDCTVSDEDLALFQEADGGLGQVRWGGSNLESTVWALSVSDESFERDGLVSYLENQFNASNASTIQKIQAAWGLTSIGKPKLLYLKQAAEFAGTYDEKILIALALAQNGEIELARELYLDILADYGYESDPYIRIQSGKTGGNSIDNTVEDSSHALLLGSLVDPAYNKGMYVYISDHEYETEDIVIDLAKIAYISEEISKAPEETTHVVYASDRQNLTKDMNTGGVWTVSIDPLEHDNYTLEVVEGKAEVSVYYYAGIDGLHESEKDNRLSLERAYRNRTGEQGKYKPGDIVEVAINFDFNRNNGPRGKYTVTDILPSGLVYIPNPSLFGYSTHTRGNEIEKNIIEFNVYNTPWWLRYNDTQLVYYARAAAAGAYKAEPAIFQFEEIPSIMTFTKENTIQITGAGQ